MLPIYKAIFKGCNLLRLVMAMQHKYAWWVEAPISKNIMVKFVHLPQWSESKKPFQTLKPSQNIGVCVCIHYTLDIQSTLPEVRYDWTLKLTQNTPSQGVYCIYIYINLYLYK